MSSPPSSSMDIDHDNDHNQDHVDIDMTEHEHVSNIGMLNPQSLLTDELTPYEPLAGEDEDNDNDNEEDHDDGHGKDNGYHMNDDGDNPMKEKDNGNGMNGNSNSLSPSSDSFSHPNDNANEENPSMDQSDPLLSSSSSPSSVLSSAPSSSPSSPSPSSPSLSSSSSPSPSPSDLLGHSLSIPNPNLFSLKRIRIADRHSHPFSKCFLCPISADFISDSDLLKHLMENHEGKSTCFGCKECTLFNSLSILKQHIKMYHSNNNNNNNNSVKSFSLPSLSLSLSPPTPFQCIDYCGEYFKDQYAFRDHIGYHEFPFRCDKCTKAFISHTKWQQHKQSVHFLEDNNIIDDERSKRKGRGQKPSRLVEEIDPYRRDKDKGNQIQRPQTLRLQDDGDDDDNGNPNGNEMKGEKRHENHSNANNSNPMDTDHNNENNPNDHDDLSTSEGEAPPRRVTRGAVNSSPPRPSSSSSSYSSHSYDSAQHHDDDNDIDEVSNDNDDDNNSSDEDEIPLSSLPPRSDRLPISLRSSPMEWISSNDEVFRLKRLPINVKKCHVTFLITPGKTHCPSLTTKRILAERKNMQQTKIKQEMSSSSPSSSSSPTAFIITSSDPFSIGMKRLSSSSSLSRPRNSHLISNPLQYHSDSDEDAKPLSSVHAHSHSQTPSNSHKKKVSLPNDNDHHLSTSVKQEHSHSSNHHHHNHPHENHNINPNSVGTIVFKKKSPFSQTDYQVIVNVPPPAPPAAPKEGRSSSHKKKPKYSDNKKSDNDDNENDDFYEGEAEAIRASSTNNNGRRRVIRQDETEDNGDDDGNSFDDPESQSQRRPRPPPPIPPHPKCPHEGCGMEFPNDEELYAHASKDHQLFICFGEQCLQSFPTVEELTSHIISIASSTGCISPCDLCCANVPGHGALKQHVKVHQLPFRCEFPGCGARFQFKRVKESHDVIHREARIELRIQQKIKEAEEAAVAAAERERKREEQRAAKEAAKVAAREAALAAGLPPPIDSDQEEEKEEAPHHIPFSSTCPLPDCPSPQDIFSSEVDLDVHIQMVHNSFKCFESECNEIFSSINERRNHLDSKKSIEELKRPHGCDLCGHRAMNATRLYRHSLLHIEQISCQFCAQNVPRSSYLKHVKTHHGARVNLIDPIIIDKENLLKSAKQPPKIKRSPCGECGQQLNSDCELIFHTMKEHQKWICVGQGCFITFASYEEFQQHFGEQRKDMREGEAGCSICCSVMTAQQYVPLHYRGHSQSVFCLYCDYRCGKNEVMKLHVQTYHAENELLFNSKSPVLIRYNKKGEPKEVVRGTRLGRKSAFSRDDSDSDKEKRNNDGDSFSDDDYGDNGGNGEDDNDNDPPPIVSDPSLEDVRPPISLCHYDDCDREFPSDFECSKHARVQHKKCLCFFPYCEKVFRSESERDEHFPLHRGGCKRVKFSCSLCGIAFYSDWLAKRHMKVHLPATQCSYCQQTFFNGESVQLHEDEKHPQPEGEKERILKEGIEMAIDREKRNQTGEKRKLRGRKVKKVKRKRRGRGKGRKSRGGNSEGESDSDSSSGSSSSGSGSSSSSSSDSDSDSSNSAGGTSRPNLQRRKKGPYTVRCLDSHCDFVAHSDLELQCHHENDHGFVYCFSCRQSFSDQEELTSHLQTGIHRGTEKEEDAPYLCLFFCGMGSTTGASANQHLLQHELRFKCPYAKCTLKFGQMRTFTLHVNVHTRNGDQNTSGLTLEEIIEEAEAAKPLYHEKILTERTQRRNQQISDRAKEIRRQNRRKQGRKGSDEEVDDSEEDEDDEEGEDDEGEGGEGGGSAKRRRRSSSRGGRRGGRGRRTPWTERRRRPHHDDDEDGPLEEEIPLTEEEIAKKKEEDEKREKELKEFRLSITSQLKENYTFSLTNPICSFKGCDVTLFAQEDIQFHTFETHGYILCANEQCLLPFPTQTDLSKHLLTRCHVTSELKDLDAQNTRLCTMFCGALTKRQMYYAHAGSHTMHHFCSFPGCKERFPFSVALRSHASTHKKKNTHAEEFELMRKIAELEVTNPEEAESLQRQLDTLHEERERMAMLEKKAQEDAEREVEREKRNKKRKAMEKSEGKKEREIEVDSDGFEKWPEEEMDDVDKDKEKSKGSKEGKKGKEGGSDDSSESESKDRKRKKKEEKLKEKEKDKEKEKKESTKKSKKDKNTNNNNNNNYPLSSLFNPFGFGNSFGNPIGNTGLYPGMMGMGSMGMGGMGNLGMNNMGMMNGMGMNNMPMMNNFGMNGMSGMMNMNNMGMMGNMNMNLNMNPLLNMNGMGMGMNGMGMGMGMGGGMNGHGNGMSMNGMNNFPFSNLSLPSSSLPTSLGDINMSPDATPSLLTTPMTSSPLFPQGNADSSSSSSSSSPLSVAAAVMRASNSGMDMNMSGDGQQGGNNNENDDDDDGDDGDVNMNDGPPPETDIYTELDHVIPSSVDDEKKLQMKQKMRSFRLINCPVKGCQDVSIFTSHSDLQNHMSEIHDKWLCFTCIRMFQSADELSKHLLTGIHKCTMDNTGEGEEVHICRHWCGVGLKSAELLSSHVGFHELYYFCSWPGTGCTRRFPSQEALKNHIEQNHLAAMDKNGKSTTAE